MSSFSRSAWRRFCRLTSCAIVVAAALAALVEIRRFHLDAPYWDGWDDLPLVEAAYEGRLGVESLVRQRTEHRQLFPRLLLIGLARLTSWSHWYECLTSLLMACAAFGWLLLLFSRAWRHTGHPPPLALGPLAAVIVFSMVQWENWLWGYQMQVFLNLLAAVSCFVTLALAPSRWPFLVAAIGAATVATFSFSNGLAVWPLGAAVLVLRPDTSARIPKLGLWCAAAAGVILYFFSGLRTPNETPSLAELPQLAVFIAKFTGGFARYISAMVAHVLGWLGLGVLAVVLGLLSRREPRSGAIAGVSAIALYGVASGVLAGLGRVVPYGTDYALSSKYTTFSVWFWAPLVGLVLLARDLAPGRARLRRLANTFALSMTAVALVGSSDARPFYRAWHRSLLQAQHQLFQPESDSLLGRFHPLPEAVRQGLPVLRRLRLSIYRCDAPLTGSDARTVAAILQSQTRAGDLVVFSNGWNASCVSDRMDRVRMPAVTTHVGPEGLAGAAHAIASGASGFLVLGGDLGDLGVARWARGFHSLFRSPYGGMDLKYFPDRPAYLRDRQAPEVTAADEAIFWSGGAADLLSGTRLDRFRLRGWEEPEVDRLGSFRWVLGTRASVYVPVSRRRPRELVAHITPLVAGSVQIITVQVNGETIGTHRVERAQELRFDLAAGAWRPGANFLDVEFARAARPVDLNAGSRDVRTLSALLRRFTLSF